MTGSNSHCGKVLGCRRQNQDNPQSPDPVDSKITTVHHFITKIKREMTCSWETGQKGEDEKMVNKQKKQKEKHDPRKQTNISSFIIPSLVIAAFV